MKTASPVPAAFLALVRAGNAGTQADVEAARAELVRLGWSVEQTPQALTSGPRPTSRGNAVELFNDLVRAVDLGWHDDAARIRERLFRTGWTASRIGG